MGIRSTISSHDFIHVGINSAKVLRDDIDEATPDHAPATKETPFEAYLKRQQAAARSSDLVWDNQAVLSDGGKAFRMADVMECSFNTFYSRFRFASAGAGKKGKRTVHRLLAPTVAVVRPRMPRAWGLETSDKRPDYCRIQLQMHKPFLNEQDYTDYLDSHQGDFVEAYKAFAGSADAPSCCRDDLHPVVFEEDGDLVDEDGATPHSSFAVYSAQYGEEVEAPTVQHVATDWRARNLESGYTDAQVSDASKWHANLKRSAVRPPAQLVDVTELNEAQAFAYRIVEAHDAEWKQSTACKPLHLAVFGTAGSGKTFLIRALKQLLGDTCEVCAPTGVASDNIGGRTYHSLLPIPRIDVDRKDVKLSEGPRLSQMKIEMQNVQYLIIDELSMVGRRALGQIDELLRQAKGNDELFGHVNVILVGDHGQLPPVKDTRCFSWADVRNVTGGPGVVGEIKESAPLWGTRGLEGYESFFENVVFLDRIMRVSDGQEQLSQEDFHFARAHLEREQGVTLERRTTPSTSASAFEAFVARQEAGGLTDDDHAIIQKHHELLENFRDLQLRARDGDLTREDYEWMKLHMNIDERRGDLQLDDAATYRLVTTRAKRDELNTTELRRCIGAGRPAITIKAQGNTPYAKQGDEDDFGGLQRTLQLCIGARVMVTHNLCVAYGLVNGTLGVVHDILVSPKDPNEVAAVLLRVKRRTSRQEGYSGPCFLRGELAADDPATEVVVSIGRFHCAIYERKLTHERGQFPIMLAWCAATRTTPVSLQRPQLAADSQSCNSILMPLAGR